MTGPTNVPRREDTAVTAPSTTEEYGALREMLIEIRTELRVLIAQHSERHADHEARIRTLEQRVDPSSTSTDHETRIRKLERTVWLAAGAASAVGGALGAWMSAVAGA